MKRDEDQQRPRRQGQKEGVVNDALGTLDRFTPRAGIEGTLYSLHELERKGFGAVSRLPVSLRVVLESVLRNVDGERVTERDVRELAGWQPRGERTAEVPFAVSRVLLQDFTGVPLLVDLAALRSAVSRGGGDPMDVAPRVPVDLVVDHSVQVDHARVPGALQLNMQAELERNRPRYEFLKWATTAFSGLQIVPPGVGICHQVNLEHLATVVVERRGVWFPDTLVGTDSHTPMVNGIGVLGWGVGGIEAEAAMLGEPVHLLIPDVVGVQLSGALREGVTATDLVLRVTELLRRAHVVGKFVEFFGEGAASLGAPERATVSNMAPEYGATVGYFPVDDETCRYLLATGRDPHRVAAVKSYLAEQGMFGIPRAGQCDYSQVIVLDLGSVRGSVSGPRRPQERIDLPDLGRRFAELLAAPPPAGFGKAVEEGRKRWRRRTGTVSGLVRGGGEQDAASLPDGRQANTSTLTEVEMMNNRPTPNEVEAASLGGTEDDVELGHGDVVIAAITSCTNTSNPGLMIAAGLLAKKAVERGLRVRDEVKTSLAPGSRVVSRYLAETGLQPYLDALGFTTVGYGCTTCIGNSGPLDPGIESLIDEFGIVAASVLSGNRNFEARIHQSVKANFLMSPPLVVVYALAGRVTLDLEREPIAKDAQGRDVYLRDLWPSSEEVAALLGAARRAESYRENYADVSTQSEGWNAIPASGGALYEWDPLSTYIQEPPYFEGVASRPAAIEDVSGARILAIFGDGISTDHISPAGAIAATSPAGRYLEAKGVSPAKFNSYGSRRGNHHVMIRGTFANPRIRNLLVTGLEGGWTAFQPGGRRLTIDEAAREYAASRTPLVVFAGTEYGSGSSRDWAAKGTALLGVRVVVARSFERIHRSNLVMMGVLPCELPEGIDAGSLRLTGDELVDVVGLDALAPRGEATLRLHRQDGTVAEIRLRVRIDTPDELETYENGGILPRVFRTFLEGS
jgi:aconitate hydratase A / 2-methylisocitrate dehydratase